ncbi:uncharacterized protein LOC135388692 [Ornithodoros turicata]|uniref:uncharacterized protein LOC135388692 n=1 Tax=Ornithodoros turicata TaxID=34597 RepID=UPI00313A3308
MAYSVSDGNLAQPEGSLELAAQGEPGEQPPLEMTLLGNGVAIPKEKWDIIFSQDEDTIFVKELAVAVWGTEVLSCKTFSGKLSNHAKAKGKVETFPALTPEKVQAVHGAFRRFLVEKKNVPEDSLQKRLKMMRVYLSQKMSDLRRPPRRALNLSPHTIHWGPVGPGWGPGWTTSRSSLVGPPAHHVWWAVGRRDNPGYKSTQEELTLTTDDVAIICTVVAHVERVLEIMLHFCEVPGATLKVDKTKGCSMGE